MKFTQVSLCVLVVCLGVGVALGQENQPVSASSATVPRLIRIRGTVHDESGKPLTGTMGITFTLYRDESGAPAVWQETQALALDASGHYSALLGATNEAGLPLEIFSSGEARWLGIRPDGQAEQPRTLFLSVAYALKAADTDMLGGRPASAYQLAGNSNQSTAAQNTSGNQLQVVASATGGLPLLMSPQASCSSVTSDGTGVANQVAKFSAACNIEPSAIFESGGSVGINTTTPGAQLDVNGFVLVEKSTTLVGGAFISPVSTATASQGFASSPLDLQASVYNSAVKLPATYMFRIQTTPLGNDTGTTNAYLNFLYGVPQSLTSTGFSIAGNGIVTFASGQKFPGTGSGTVTSVGTGAGLTGGPITGSGTISIPSAGVTNSMLANNSITVKAGSGLGGGGTVALGGTVTLTNAGGTVTSVATGAGLTGGPITGSGTISIPSAGVTNSMLANNSITVTPGSGLSGGGTVTLGGTVGLSANLSGTTNGIGYFASPASVTSTAAPTDGQVLIGSAGKAPVLGTLTAGSNVTITNGPGTITIAASGGGGSTPLPFFVTGGDRTGSTQAATANVTKVWGFLLPYAVTTTQVIYDVTTADKSANDYDIGIFDNSGNLVVDVGQVAGTTFSPKVGFVTLPWAQGSTALSAGRYYLAITTNCSGSSCAKLAGGATTISFAVNSSAGASSGGTLPSSITPPADNWVSGTQISVVIE